MPFPLLANRRAFDGTNRPPLVDWEGKTERGGDRTRANARCRRRVPVRGVGALSPLPFGSVTEVAPRVVGWRPKILKMTITTQRKTEKPPTPTAEQEIHRGAAATGGRARSGNRRLLLLEALEETTN